MGFNVVLIEPQIPNNTGNIGRTCVATCSSLHLVHPLGFEITDSRVKRAGLDYWPELELYHYANLTEFLGKVDSSKNMYFFSARADQSFYDCSLNDGDYLIFGKEAEGFSDHIKKTFEEKLVQIPFPGRVRSFNLSNAVAMALGEGIRQLPVNS